MRIIVDTREQTPWTFKGMDVTTEPGKLVAGDYSLPGLERRVSIERKSLSDWIGTVMRDRSRFYRELELLRGYEFRAVIIECGVRQIVRREYRSEVKPASILGFIGEVTVAQNVPVYLAGSRPEAQILAVAFLRQASKKIQPR